MLNPTLDIKETDLDFVVIFLSNLKITNSTVQNTFDLGYSCS